MTLEFKRSQTDILITASASGILFSGHWTVAILKEHLIHYVNTFNSNPESGFVVHGEEVVFIHEVARIRLSKDEANQFVSYIKAQYMG